MHYCIAMHYMPLPLDVPAVGGFLSNSFVAVGRGFSAAAVVGFVCSSFAAVGTAISTVYALGK